MEARGRGVEEARGRGVERARKVVMMLAVWGGLQDERQRVFLFAGENVRRRLFLAGKNESH